MTPMPDAKPINLHPHEVRGAIDGRQTQLRRVLKPQPLMSLQPILDLGVPIGINERGAIEYRPMPYVAGDILWAQETFFCDDTSYPDGVPESAMWREVDGKREPIPLAEQRAEMLEEMYFRADGEPEFEAPDGPTPWKASTQMPRWASRLTLEVTEVRVQRLQEIDPIDACEEGIAWTEARPGGAKIWSVSGTGIGEPTPIEAFRTLWDGINEKRGFGWDANPWVVAVTFKPHQVNVDEFLKTANEQRKDGRQR